MSSIRCTFALLVARLYVIFMSIWYISFSFAGGKTTILLMGGRPVQQLMKNLIKSKSKLMSTPMARTAETIIQWGDDRAMRIAVIYDCKCQFSSGIKPIKCVVKMSSSKLGLRMRLLAMDKESRSRRPTRLHVTRWHRFESANERRACGRAGLVTSDVALPAPAAASAAAIPPARPPVSPCADPRP